MSLRIPIDSIVVLPQHTGVAVHDAWSAKAADEIAACLAADARLRVVPSDRVHAIADAAERGAEEIGRELNVGAAVLCAMNAELPALDLAIELIDVLGEATVGRQVFLSSSVSAARLWPQAARVIQRWLARSV